MADIFDFIADWWKDITIGEAPKVITDHLVSGEVGKGLKNKITRRVNKILNSHPDNHHKFGKSGQAPFRVKHDDYREESYTKMFLLYESANKDHVSFMEVYYIKLYKHLRRNDNISEAKGYTMRSYHGLYHLYIVI